MGYFNHDQYVEVTMHFRCNLRCEHCMIEETMDRLEPESDEKFEKLIQTNHREHLWKGIVFTGSEVTLRNDLPKLARRAREHGFDHVRIQTHGMRLTNRDYCRELVDAGVNEFFVSVAAADAATHDGITDVPGSFAKTIQGLENLEEFENVVTFTNTVITRLSYRQLPQVVSRLSHLQRLVQMDFWNYWPMNDTDEKDLIVSHAEILPYLVDASARAQALGRAVEIKNFPECLLGDHRNGLDNDQPKLIIDPSFWKEFHRNGFHQCVHRDSCHSTKCLGLTTAYIEKFGWERDLLSPLNDRGISNDARIPVESANEDSHSPGKTVPFHENDRSRGVLQLIQELGLKHSTERSFRICHGSLETDRFLVTLNKRLIRKRPNQTIMDICRRMRMPSTLLAKLGERLSIAPFVHLGYERRGEADLYKVYLEFAMPPQVNADPRLLYIAFKWDSQKPERKIVTSYRWFPKLTVDGIQSRIADLYNEPQNDALQQVGAILSLAKDRNPATQFRYLEVTEDQNQRRSFDLNLYDAELQIKDVRQPLAAMFARHQIPDRNFRQLYDTIQLQPFGHLAGGIHREGLDFFNIYYGVEYHKPTTTVGSSE